MEQKNTVFHELLAVWKRADHRRHDLTLAICGNLQKNGWSVEDAKYVISGLIRLSGKGREHVKVVRSAMAESERKYGLPHIIQIAKQVGVNVKDERRS